MPSRAGSRYIGAGQESGSPRGDLAPGPRSQSPLVLGVGGAAGAGDGVDLALLVALSGAERAGASVRFLGSRFLDDGGDDAGDEASAAIAAGRLLDAVAMADGLILAGATADGTLSPPLLDALAWLRDDDIGALRGALRGKAVACVVTASDPRLARWGLTALRTAVHDLGGWPTPTGVSIALSEQPFHPIGTCSRPELGRRLAQAGEEVVQFALAQRAHAANRRRAAA